MNHIKFNVGDEVEYLGDTNKVKRGYTGKIVDLYGDDVETILSVNWDKHINGHACEGLARPGHGWNVYARHVKLLKSNINLNPADVKYAHIIRKSKQLNDRFVNRKKGTEYAF